MPAWPGDRHEPGPVLAGGRVEQVLEQAQLRVPTDERSLEAVRAAHALALGNHAQRDPCRDRQVLALEVLRPGRFEGDRPGRGPLGRLADEDGARRGGGLQSRRRIDEVARDHALVRRADGDRRLAREDAGPRLEARIDRPDRVDQFESRADTSLGVVLVRDGGAPDGHDGIADELLDGAAVTLDDVASDIEVASQQLADRLGITALGQRGEADEVREQDRDEATFRDRGSSGTSEATACLDHPRDLHRTPRPRCRAAPHSHRRTGQWGRWRRRSWAVRRPASCRTRGRTCGRRH